MNADERLVVMLEARISEFEKRMRQAESRGTRTYQGLERNSRSATRQMEQDMLRSTSRINQALAATSTRIGAFGKAFIAGLSVGAVAQLTQRYTQIADAATQMQNSLRTAGLEGADLSRVYEQLFRSAQRNSAPIGSLVDLYSKLSLTQKELGVTSDDLIRFTDGIAVALKVAGTDATAASGALLQLSQGLGGGIVRAEEFNSILEGTPTIAQAVARGLKEANGSVAELRKLVNDGEVSSSAFFRAFEAGSVELRGQAEASQSTVGQAFTRIANSLVTVVGEFDKTSGASAGLSGTLNDLADGMDRFDTAGFVSRIQSIAQAFRDAEGDAAAWIRQMANAQAFADLNEVMGLAEGGQIINPDVREAEQKIGVLEKDIEALQAQIENNTSLGFDNTEAIARLNEVRSVLAALRAEASNMPRHVEGLRPGGEVVTNNTDSGSPISAYSPPPVPVSSTPVSIADFPAGGSGTTGGGGGGRRSRGGGGGRSRKAELDDYAKEVKAIRERTAALQTEAAVLVSVAASGTDYGDALEFARQKAELLHAAQQAGKKITPELEAEIDKLADAYVQAGLEAEGAAEKLDAIKERSEAGKNALSDMFGSIVDGSKSAKQAVADLLLEIAKTQMINGIMGLPGMGGLASSIGGLLVPGFASGGSHLGGLRIVGEKGPELEATGPSRIWNADQTRNLLAGRQGSTGTTTAPAINFAPVTNLTVEGNADEKTLARMRQMLDQNNKQFARQIPEILDNHNKRSR
ncbi:tape measure protein [Paracoccus actinidiae]|uniref:tape measure protein n=1 Tax=Paracoccus actinidiae TaxID=3064531 RepID=UPI0027D28F82|nr:tape measure protein [Paracoccus sp. M09]